MGKIRVKTISNGKYLKIYAYGPEPTFRIPLYQFNKQELYNLFGLIYFCLRNCVIINPCESIAAKLSHYVKIDVEKKIVTTQEGIKLSLDSIDPVIFLETFIMGIHEIFTKDLKGKTVLDIGAAFGDTALYFASKGAKVLAVEPVEFNVKAIKKNMDLNLKLKKRITTIHAAVGKDGFLDISHLDDIIDCSAAAYDDFALKSVGVERIKSYSISSLLDELGMEHVDYLKSDAKGAERFFAEKDLDRIKSYLKIEINQSEGRGFKELLDRMEKVGFRYSLMQYAPADEIKSEVGGGMICGVRR